MWFRNLMVFQVAEPLADSAEALAGRLAQGAFRPCGSQELATHGWSPPLGRKAADLVHAANGCWLMCLKSEEKLLPAAVLREAVTVRAAQIEEQEGRPVRRREREALRDDILLELLPRALTRSRTTLGYLDPRHGWLVIDSGNRKTVELFTHALRKTLGSLAVAGLRTAAAPAAVMTGWLADGGPPADVTLADECELRDESDGGIVRCKGQDLTGDEIQAHLQARKQATRLGLTWNQRLALVLADDLTVRRLRFLDVVREPAGDAESELERRDAEFALMSGELAVFLPRLIEIFGGPAA